MTPRLVTLKEATVSPGSNGSYREAAQPIYDIVLPPTATAVRGSASPGMDVAPAGGMDIAVVGLVAAVIAAVLVLIVRSRRRGG